MAIPCAIYCTARLIDYQLAGLSKSTYENDEERVESVRNGIVENYPSAHTGIFKMFGCAE
jgi:hypothetical protein